MPGQGLRLALQDFGERDRHGGNRYRMLTPIRELPLGETVTFIRSGSPTQDDYGNDVPGAPCGIVRGSGALSTTSFAGMASTGASNGVTFSTAAAQRA